MKMVKIQISETARRAEAIAHLTLRGKVICLPDHTYVVPEPALAVLQEREVMFVELGRGGLDYAEKTLRDSLANRTQRRATG